jgi:dTMP kinase
MLIKGKFIVLEGLDRSGKSSVAKFLSQKLSLEKGPTVLMNFPDRTTSIGKMINHFLNNQVELGNEAIHLLFSANRWENSSKISNYL